MDELITKIEETVSALLKYDMEKYSTTAQELVNLMMTILPAIIDCYNDPAMSDIREDATYWPGQMQRIIDSLGTGDCFEVTDVLYNETRPNLIELKGYLVQRGLL